MDCFEALPLAMTMKRACNGEERGTGGEDDVRVTCESVALFFVLNLI